MCLETSLWRFFPKTGPGPYTDAPFWDVDDLDDLDDDDFDNFDDVDFNNFDKFVIAPPTPPKKLSRAFRRVQLLGGFLGGVGGAVELTSAPLSRVEASSQ